MSFFAERRLALLILALGTCFGVFFLPFLFPPPPLQGISAANVAGFNNKLAAVATALVSIAALAWFFFFEQIRHETPEDNSDLGSIPNRTIFVGTVLICGITTVLLILMARSAELYRDDLDYFVDRLTQHVHFGRVLYDQIEFPYGPLLFYLPLLFQKLLLPLHLSLRASYLVALDALYSVGMLLLAYILNALRMSRSWKLFGFVALGLQTFQLNFGFNYTLFRFLIAFACLIFAARRKTVAWIALSMTFGQVLCLATSPEMGFAFLAGSMAYAAYRLVQERSLRLLVLLATPLMATALFFAVSVALAGQGSLRMLGMFSRGVYNLVVEPLPYILIFLFAVAGLVPWMLARTFRSRSEDAPLLAALYVGSLALLPVALGRCDPDHVLLNGIGIYLLSFVAASALSRRWQIAWRGATCCALLYVLVVIQLGYAYPLKVNGVSSMQRTRGLDRLGIFLAHHAPRMGFAKLMLQPVPQQKLDVERLHAITGGEEIATPVATSRAVQEQLLHAGLLAPSFYYFRIAVIDHQAELHEIAELNQHKWALIDPTVPLELTERLEYQPIGFTFHYSSKRAPYITGYLFRDNLKTNWVPVTTMSSYILYQRRSASAQRD